MTLTAREPWKLACRAHEYLGFVESPGELKDWKIYWMSGLISLRSVGHVLLYEDAKKSDLHDSINKDLWIHIKKCGGPIHFNFLIGERDNILKHHKFGVLPTKHTVSRFLTDYGKTYDELVRENGEFTELSWAAEGYDALMLFETMIVWWHEHLTIFEQAVCEKITDPFTQCNSIRNMLLEKGNFVQTCPKTPRL